MTYSVQEVYSSYMSAMIGLEKAIADGWKLSEESPPDMVGFNYSLTLVRDDEPVVKMTRAEILTKARAARVFKKGAENV